MTGISYPAREGTTRNNAERGLSARRGVPGSCCWVDRSPCDEEPTGHEFGTDHEPPLLVVRRRRLRFIVIASILSADPTVGSCVASLQGLRFALKPKFASATSRLSRKRSSLLGGRSREQKPHPQADVNIVSRSLTSRLCPRLLRSPVPPLNGFRRLGSRQSGERLARPRHWLQPTTAPVRYLPRYGLLWLRRSRDNRGREEWRQTARRLRSPRTAAATR